MTGCHLSLVERHLQFVVHRLQLLVFLRYAADGYGWQQRRVACAVVSTCWRASPHRRRQTAALLGCVSNRMQSRSQYTRDRWHCTACWSPASAKTRAESRCAAVQSIHHPRQHLQNWTTSTFMQVAMCQSLNDHFSMNLTELARTLYSQIILHTNCWLQKCNKAK